MALPTQLKQELKQSGNQIVAADRLNQLIARIDIKKRFEEILGDKAAGFMSSIISVVNSNTALKTVDPNSILSAAVIAATLDLPINQSLGFAYIIPYKDKAQFQIGYKGFIQLAIRTGQYETMNTSEIYADEIDFWNPITGEIKFTSQDHWKMRDEGRTEKIVGYIAFFKLSNGFRKYLYMTQAQLDAHGRKFSQSYDRPFGQWKKDPHSMKLKTVIKLLLSKYGLMSVEMQRALQFDQGVIKQFPHTNEAIDVTYPDSNDVPEGAPSMSAEEMQQMESDVKAAQEVVQKGTLKNEELI